MKNTLRHKNKKNKQTMKKRGSGFKDVLYKYTFGEKCAELIPQARSIFQGFREGYGLGGIGGGTQDLLIMLNAYIFLNECALNEFFF